MSRAILSDSLTQFHNTFIGIDPGLTGAIAFLGPDQECVIDIPLLSDRRVDAYALSIRIQAINKKYRYCCLEHSQAMPGQGVVSMFNYGVTYGIIFGVLVYTKTYFIEIAPRKWKKEFGLLSDKKAGIIKKKEDSCIIAATLFPKLKEKLIIKGKKGYIYKHGRADALLIAAYCKGVYVNQTTN